MRVLWYVVDFFVRDLFFWFFLKGGVHITICISPQPMHKSVSQVTIQASRILCAGNSLCRKHASHMSLYLVAANCENLPELDWWKTVKCRMSVSKVSETGKKTVVYDKEIDKRKFDWSV